MFGIPMIYLRLAAAAVVAGLLWWGIATVTGWRADSQKLDAAETALEAVQAQRKADLDAWQAQHDKDAAQALTDTQTAQNALNEATRVQFERDSLLQRVAALSADKKLTVEVPHENACPTVRLSPDVRMCINAAALGSANSCPASEAVTVPASL